MKQLCTGFIFSGEQKLHSNRIHQEKFPFCRVIGVHMDTDQGGIL
jgi:hypothetical protein